MKKPAFPLTFKALLFLLLLTGFETFATHNRGGYITYRHVSGFTYEASIVTFTRESSPADRCELTINWGDGYTEVLPRSNGDTLVCPDAQDGEFIGNDMRLNIYTGRHTYPSTGVYVLSMEDPNRTAGIANILQSVSVPFHLRSELIIDPSSAPGHAPRLVVPPATRAIVNQSFSVNLTAFDPDGDNLQYELVPAKGKDGLNITTTYDPQIVQDLPKIDPWTGELTWNPANVGNYTFAVKVSECRDNTIGGSIIVDFTISVNYAAITSDPQFSNIASWQKDSAGRYSYTIAPGSNLQLKPAFSDIPGYSVDMLAYSELFMSATSVSFTTDSTGSGYLRKEFNYTPAQSDARCMPYLVSFRGTTASTNDYSTSKDISLLIYVRDSAMAPCDSSCFLLSSPEIEAEPMQVSIAPNPFRESTEIRISGNSENAEFLLYDLRGQLRTSMKFEDSRTLRLQRKGLEPGIYLYVIREGQHYRSSGKLMVAP